MRVGSIVVVMCALVATARADPDPAAAALAKLATAARCSDASSPWRAWCIATKWQSGTAAPLPARTLIGMSLELEDGKDIADELVNHVTPATFSSDANGVKVAYLTPSNDQERDAIARAVIAVSAQLKGAAPIATLPADVASYIVTVKGLHPATKQGGAWTWQSDAQVARARKVGNYWVVIESPKSGPSGIWVTVLTDAWQ